MCVRCVAEESQAVQYVYCLMGIIAAHKSSVYVLVYVRLRDKCVCIRGICHTTLHNFQIIIKKKKLQNMFFFLIGVLIRYNIIYLSGIFCCGEVPLCTVLFSSSNAISTYIIKITIYTPTYMC